MYDTVYPVFLALYGTSSETVCFLYVGFQEKIIEFNRCMQLKKNSIYYIYIID